MRFLYSILYTCALLIALPYFLVVGLFRGKYLSSAVQRLGFISVSTERPSVWIHAVSVGEFLAAKRLIRGLQQQYPDIPLFVSTTTITGQRLASDFLPGASFYFPFDWRSCIRRAFQRVNPRLILVMETEIWPNFLWESQDRKVPVVLVNGRLSERSFARYRLFRFWAPPFSEALMQSDKDALRMNALGFPQERIKVMGNMKFDFHPPVLEQGLRKLLLDWKSSSLLWIAGSTMPGEEEILLDVFADLRANHDVRLMIAPRHPERFAEVKQLIEKKHYSFTLRSKGETKDEPILLLDSIGELAACYELADLVFIGGTLKEYGGHNPIEPAFFGKAIFAGTHFENFRSIFEEFQQREAILISSSIREAAAVLLNNPDRRNRMGTAAFGIVQRNAGATEIVLEIVRNYLNDRSLVEQNQKLLVR